MRNINTSYNNIVLSELYGIESKTAIAGLLGGFSLVLSELYGIERK